MNNGSGNLPGAATDFGLVVATCGYFGFAAAIYLALCDIALEKPGVAWDAVAVLVSCALIATGRHLMTDAE